MKIQRLEITSPNLDEQRQFYHHTLGLEFQNDTGKSFEVNVGFSVLKITQDPGATPYHIAFHIPPKAIKPALAWVKGRLEIQMNGEEEIVDFSAWKAMSLYFYDAGKNILEFISREDLYPPREETFSEKSILGIAEIGMVTHDIPEKYKILNQISGLEKFDGNFKNFCAIGDDKGLIITIDNHKKDWFPTNDKAFVSDFKMTFEHSNKNYRLAFEKDKLVIAQTE